MIARKPRLGRMGRVLRKGTPEGAVLRDCLDLLQLRGILAWRNTNASVPILVGGQLKGFRPTPNPGMSDITAVLPGGVIAAIECKAAGGKLSDSQAAFLAAITRAGGVAIVAHSAGELDAALEPWREEGER